MDTPSPANTGLVGSLGTLAHGLIESAHDRLQLLSVELHEEKFRLVQTFIWISAAIFSGMMAIMFASLTIVYLFWESARLWALGGLTLLYAGALVLIIRNFRRHLERQPKPFAATINELKNDAACIPTKN